MAWPPSRDDLTRLGLLESYQPEARPLEAIHVAANLFELRGHGLSGARVRFSAGQAGVLAAPLSALAWYPVLATDDPDFFALAGVTLTNAGEGTIVVLEDNGPKVDAWLAERASWVEARAKAYAGPWASAPDWAIGLVCRLVSYDAATRLRLPSARYPLEDLRKIHETAEAFIRESLAVGQPAAKGQEPVDATPTVAEMGAVLIPMRDTFDFPLGDNRA